MIDPMSIAAARRSLAAQQAQAERFAPLVPAPSTRPGRASARRPLGRVPQAGAHPGFRLFGGWSVRVLGR
jgi:hypothetical protein